jgi:transketolase
MAKYDYGFGASRMLAGQGVFEISQKSDKIWGITSDVGGSFKKFRELWPTRFVDTGIAEQTATGIAAGLAIEGFKPYIIGMIPFLTMRACEQVRTDICYQNLPVTIIGTGGGLVSTGGATHNAMEDVAIMRTFANMSVLSISDPNMILPLMHASLEWNGPLFIRQAGGKSDRIIYEPGKQNYAIGKGIEARPGKDVTIIAHGGMVVDSLDVAEDLAGKGVDVRVIDMYSIKPLDNELILKAAAETGKIIVVEDHLRRGGLSSAVAELLMDEGAQLKKFSRLGVPDVYAGYGPGEELREKYGYGKTAIAEKVMEFVK